MATESAKLVDVLLNNGASLDSRDLIDRTPLHLAAEMGYLEGIQLLLKHNADIHARDSWAMTPFEIATSNRRPDAMQLLLDLGAVDHRTY